MYLVCAISKLLALLELIRDVGVAGRRDQGWEPVQPGCDFILHFSGWHLAGPAQDHRYPKATFERSALTTSKWRLPAVGPGEVLCAVVGCEADDGITFEAVVLQV